MPFDTQMCNLSLVSYNIYFPMELYLDNTIGTDTTYEAMVNFFLQAQGIAENLGKQWMETRQYHLLEWSI